jgi:hypothetical protein
VRHQIAGQPPQRRDRDPQDHLVEVLAGAELDVLLVSPPCRGILQMQPIGNRVR